MQCFKRGKREVKRLFCDGRKRKRKGGKRNGTELWMSIREKRAVAKCTENAQRKRDTAERLGITAS